MKVSPELEISMFLLGLQIETSPYEADFLSSPLLNELVTGIVFCCALGPVDIQNFDSILMIDKLRLFSGKFPKVRCSKRL